MLNLSFGWVSFLSLSFIPVLLWLPLGTPGTRLASIGSLGTSLGQITGLVGLAMFSLAMVLSVRLPIFDRWFGGMNRAYIAHHIIGGTAFILLLIHPIFLAIQYAQNSLVSVGYFFLPDAGVSLNLGKISLLLLMTLLILTYYVNLPYELWRFTHKFMGLTLALGAIHGLLMPSDISRSTPLLLYMVTIVGFGLIGYIYRTLLGRFLIRRKQFFVQEMHLVSPAVTEITLLPEYAKETFSFLPGQFVFVRFLTKTRKHETHPFSLSSAPQTDGKITITVKALGDFTKSFTDITPNTKTEVEGPFGAFSWSLYPHASQIWIAGGIGVTPFLSMARSLPVSHPPILLWYTVRDESEAVMLTELREIAKTHPSFIVTLWTSSKQGRLTVETIANQLPDLNTRHIFLCGPPPLMLSLKGQLRHIKVARDHIHSEEFSIL